MNSHTSVSSFDGDIPFASEKSVEEVYVSEDKAPSRQSRKKFYAIVAVVVVAVVIAVAVAVSTGGSGGDKNDSNQSQATLDDKQTQSGELPTESPASNACESGDAATLETLPNVGFMLSGYNILKGNPLATSTNRKAGSDPGFAQPVFASSFSQCATTGDRRFAIPDGTQLLSCSGTCSLSFSSSIIETTAQYSDRLAVRASLSGSGSKFGFDGAFSASADYQRVSRETQQNSLTVVQSESSCCAYEGNILSFTPPPFHPNFLSGLQKLPETFDDEAYSAFVDTFGTHYVQGVTMGALLGDQSFVSEASRTFFRQENIDIAAAASASGFGYSVSAEVQTEIEREMATTFRSNSQERAVYSLGVAPPKDGDTVAWAQQVSQSPAPIGLELDRLDNLDLPVSDAVKKNLQRSIDGYCSSLVTRGEEPTCDPVDYITSDWINPELSGVASRPVLCPPGTFIKGMTYFDQDLIGFANVNITCSDDTVISFRDEFSGNTSSVFCANGFDAMQAYTGTNAEGPNDGLPIITKMGFSCNKESTVVPIVGQTGRLIRVEDRPELSDFQNQFDRPLNFNTNDPLCGTFSVHSNSHEDRRFKFSTCPIREPGTEYSIIEYSQELDQTQYDATWTLSCGADEVMTGLKSHHSNSREDRQWTATCSHYRNTKVQNCGPFSNFVNSYDAVVDFHCPVNQVLTGIASRHRNSFEDRQWRFQCCELHVDDQLNNEVFCPGETVAIGMQFLELNDPDGGIVRTRFLCGSPSL